MKSFKILFTLCLIITATIVNSQTEKSASEIEQITKTLMDYIEGTANGEPDRVTRAFHKDLNLYTMDNDSLKVWNGKNYISGIKEGRKSNRIGKIVSMDYENNAASAKIEILMPNAKRIYTDYLLLLKVKGKWKIIHKSYTYVAYPE
ncbi:nuclear transport factor 2 family protein [Lacinutrix chionoecetis]